MKLQRVLLPPPPDLRVTPSIKFAGSHFIHLGGETHCESKVFCPRKQRDVPVNVPGDKRTNHEATTPSRYIWTWNKKFLKNFSLLGSFWRRLPEVEISLPACFNAPLQLEGWNPWMWMVKWPKQGASQRSQWTERIDKSLEKKTKVRRLLCAMLASSHSNLNFYSWTSVRCTYLKARNSFGNCWPKSKNLLVIIKHQIIKLVSVSYLGLYWADHKWSSTTVATFCRYISEA